MRRAFVSVGNNLNQVAYRLNDGQLVSTPEIKKIQEELQRAFRELYFYYRRLEGELR